MDQFVTFRARTILFGLLIFIAGFWCWRMMMSPGTLPIKTVKVFSSYSHIAQKELKEIISPFVDDSLLRVDLKGLRNHLLNKPWVQQVKVARAWPDTVKVSVVERKPLTRWKQHSLLSLEGEIFTPAKDEISYDLPLLSGPDRLASDVLQQYENISKMVASVGVRVTELHMTERHSWTLKLNNGMTVLVGKRQPLAQIARFVKSYDEIFGSNGADVEQVDLRYAHGMAVRWRSKAKM